MMNTLDWVGMLSSGAAAFIAGGISSYVGVRVAVADLKGRINQIEAVQQVRHEENLRRMTAVEDKLSG